MKKLVVVRVIGGSRLKSPLPSQTEILPVPAVIVSRLPSRLKSAVVRVVLVPAVGAGSVGVE